MFNVRSSTYKVALWIAGLPFAFFVAGFVEQAARYRLPAQFETVGLTLVVWLLGCWQVHWEWSALRTRQRRWMERRARMRQPWRRILAALAPLPLLLVYYLHAPANAIGLAISLVIVSVLEALMVHACLREHRVLYW